MCSFFNTRWILAHWVVICLSDVVGIGVVIFFASSTEQSDLFPFVCVAASISGGAILVALLLTVVMSLRSPQYADEWCDFLLSCCVIACCPNEWVFRAVLDRRNSFSPRSDGCHAIVTWWLSVRHSDIAADIINRRCAEAVVLQTFCTKRIREEASRILSGKSLHRSCRLWELLVDMVHWFRHDVPGGFGFEEMVIIGVVLFVASAAIFLVCFSFDLTHRILLSTNEYDMCTVYFAVAYLLLRLVDIFVLLHLWALYSRLEPLFCVGAVRWNDSTLREVRNMYNRRVQHLCRSWAAQLYALTTSFRENEQSDLTNSIYSLRPEIMRFGGWDDTLTSSRKLLLEMLVRSLCSSRHIVVPPVRVCDEDEHTPLIMPKKLTYRAC